MSLSLIGAVGVRVRPDTKGFRQKTKQEILSQLRDLDVPVEIEAKYDINDKGMKGDLDKLLKDLKGTQKVDVEARAKFDKSDLGKQIRELQQDLSKKTFELRAPDIDKAAKSVTQMRDYLDELSDAAERTGHDLEAMAGVGDADMSVINREVSKASQLVDKLGDDAEKAAKKADSLQWAYEDARRALDETDQFSEHFTDAEVARLDRLAKKRKEAMDAVDDGDLSERALKRMRETEQVWSEAFEKANQAAQGRLAEQALSTEKAFTAALDDLNKVNQALDDQAYRYGELTASRDKLMRQQSEEVQQLSEVHANQLKLVEQKKIALAADEASLQIMEEQRAAAIRQHAEEAERLARFVMLHRTSVAQVREAWSELGKYTPNFVGRWGETLAKGAMGTAGIGTFRRLSTEMRESIRNMDVLSTTTAKLGTAFTAMGASALGATGAVMNIGHDLTKMIGLGAAAPAFLAQLGAQAFVTAKGFKGMLAASQDLGSKEFAALPEAAKKAARAFNSLGTELNESIQPAMWEAIGDSMGEAVRAMEEDLVEGLTRMARVTGEGIGDVSREFEAFADRGALSKTMDNLVRGGQHFAKAFGPASSALLSFIEAGSATMPAFNRWIREGAEGLKDWSSAAAASGDMQRWIMDGAEAARHLGAVVRDTVGIMDDFAAVTERAGGPGLADFAAGLQRVRQATGGEFFQGHMTDIMRGALSASRDLAEGFGHLGESILSESENIETALETVGRVGETTLTALGDAFRNDRLQQGILDFVSDVEDASARFPNILDNLAGAGGDFLSVGGELVKAAVKIGDAFLEVWSETNGLTESLQDFIPVASDITVGFIRLAHGPVQILIEGLARLVDGFVALPSPIQHALLALGAMAYMGSRFSGLLGVLGKLGTAAIGLGTAFATAGRSASGSFRELANNSGALTRLERGFITSGTAARTSMGHFRSAGASLGELRTNAAQAGTSLGNFARNQYNLTRMPATFASISQGLREVPGRLQSAATATGRWVSASSGVQRLQGWYSTAATAASRYGESVRNIGAQTRSAFAEAGAPRAISNMTSALNTARTATTNFVSAQAGIARANPHIAAMSAQFRTLAGTMSSLGRGGAASGFSSTISQMTGAMGRFNAAYPTFSSSVRNMGTSLASAAASMGRGIGGGLKGAITGIVQSLGPWNIAFAAAGVAVMEFARLSAESKGRVEELRGTLDEFGSATSQTGDAVAEMMTSWNGSFMTRNFATWGDSVVDVMDRVGLSAGELGDMFVNNRPKYDELSDAMTRLGSVGTQDFNNAVRDTATALGISEEKVRANRGELEVLGVQMGRAATEAGTASSQFDSLGSSLDDLGAGASAETQALADALRTVGDEASSSETRVDALKRAISALNGEDITADESIKALTDEITAANEAMPRMTEEYGNLAQSAYDASGKLDLTTAAGSELDTTMKSLIDSAYDQGIATDDMAGAMERSRAAFQGMAEDAGYTGADLDRLMATYDDLANAEDAELGVELVGAEDAMEQADGLAQLLGTEFDQREFAAWLKADPENAKLAAEDATAAAEKFANDTYQGELGFDSHMAQTAIQALEARGLEWDSARFQAWLDADPANAELAASNADAAAKAFAGSEYKATLAADGSVGKAMIEELQGRGDAFNQSRFEAWLGMNAEEFNQKQMSADQILDAWDQESHRVRVGMDDSELQGRMTTIMSTLNSMEASQWSAYLTADATAFMDVMQYAESKGVEIRNPEAFKAYIGANAEQFKSEGLSVDQILDRWRNNPANISVNAETAAAEASLGRLVERTITVDGKQIRVNVTEQGADQVVNKIQNLPDGHAIVYVKENGVAGVASDIKSVPDGASIVHVGENGVDTVTGQIKGVPDGDSIVYVDENGVMGVTNSINGVPDGASTVFVGENGVGAVQGRINSITGKTVTITAVVSAVGNAAGKWLAGALADGGIMFKDGGIAGPIGQFARAVDRFAKGGITGRAVAQQFADGGESHLARISRPMTQFRVWAEPETGGEAYIPLASSKRARSTRIWEATGARLGIDVNKYADGDVTGGSAYTPAGRAARSGTTINVTNHYPQAEPTSTTTNRALQFAADLS